MTRYILMAVLLVVAPLSYSEQAFNMDLSSAERVVNQYRELRKLCIVSSADDRKACFRTLNSANSDYREAKAVLAAKTAEQADQDYLVRFSYQ